MVARAPSTPAIVVTTGSMAARLVSGSPSVTWEERMIPAEALPFHLQHVFRGKALP